VQSKNNNPDKFHGAIFVPLLVTRIVNTTIKYSLHSAPPLPFIGNSICIYASEYMRKQRKETWKQQPTSDFYGFRMLQWLIRQGKYLRSGNRLRHSGLFPLRRQRTRRYGFSYIPCQQSVIDATLIGPAGSSCRGSVQLLFVIAILPGQISALQCLTLNEKPEYCICSFAC
jgi:hypothetical protein